MRAKWIKAVNITSSLSKRESDPLQGASLRRCGRGSRGDEINSDRGIRNAESPTAQIRIENGYTPRGCRSRTTRPPRRRARRLRGNDRQHARHRCHCAFLKLQRGMMRIASPERVFITREFLDGRRQRIEVLPEARMRFADHGRSCRSRREYRRELLPRRCSNARQPRNPHRSADPKPPDRAPG